jgi:hypothetical protein
MKRAYGRPNCSDKGDAACPLTASFLMEAAMDLQDLITIELAVSSLSTGLQKFDLMSFTG